MSGPFSMQSDPNGEADVRLGATSIGPALAVSVFFGVTIVSLFALPQLHLAANRLVVGDPYYAYAVFGRLKGPIVGLLVVGYGFLAARIRRHDSIAAQVALISALSLVAFSFGSAAEGLTEGRPGATRVRLASGALLGCTSLLLAIAWSVRPCSVLRKRLTSLSCAVVLVALGWSGHFDRLSIAIEFHARRRELLTAVMEHIVLSIAALLLAFAAVAILFALRRMRGAIEQGVAGIQVVPSVALFGALVVAISTLLNAVPSLRDLGVSALGTAPAVIGVAAYLLLPLWRGLYAALNTADASTIEAAEAIGFNRYQMLTRVRLPLGAPVLIGALRVSAVQSIGLTTLGALVGAGGLGRIVFDGMGQLATDLIILGALPILGLSYAADRALGCIEASVTRT